MPRRTRTRRRPKPRPVVGPNSYSAARVALRRMRVPPSLWEWEYLLMEEILARYPTKTEAAQVLGLSREGFRKKLIRMGFDW